MEFPKISYLLILIIIITSSSLPLMSCQSSLCRTSCGGIPINYPLSIDDGCGSPYYRRILVCSEPANVLELWTPSGRYPVKSISYTDPHILISDPLMWACHDGDRFRPTRALSMDTSIHFSVSSQNEYLFFNCSPDRVLMEPRPMFCERFPERCDSTCDPSSYLCRHLPQCAPNALKDSSCCSYYPKATESLRMMLKHCATYTSIYWKNVGGIGTTKPYDQVPEYGVRVDFEIPVTSRCLRCQDRAKGGGTCGFETTNQGFLCLCDHGNATSYCKDHSLVRHSGNAGAIAGTVTAASVAAGMGIGAGIWYLRRVRAKAPVTHGVQTNDNRLF